MDEVKSKGDAEEVTEVSSQRTESLKKDQYVKRGE